MFKIFNTLFCSPSARARHATGPLAKERSAYLSHLESQGLSRKTLLSYAPVLLVVATFLRSRRGRILRSQLVLWARQWARSRRRLGLAKTLQWPESHFVQKGSAWCSFMGRLKEEHRTAPYHAVQTQTWASSLRTEEGLSERTIYGYRWWITKFREWLVQKELPLRLVTPNRVDAFLKQLASKGMGRITLSDAASVLRKFLHYAYQQGWCRRDLAPFILSPRVFRYENMPAGPSWLDVKQLIAATDGPTNGDLRNRAMLLLLAVYGLRCGEVTALRLDDLDWTRRILLVTRIKTARMQEYPLSVATGQAIERYLKEARPMSEEPEVFLTLRAPFRRLSAGAIYEVTSSLFNRVGIVGCKRGPHALRHACGTYLLNTGSSLKAVGDHLGHQCSSATQIYAKVDLAGLRAVASFDLGDLA